MKSALVFILMTTLTTCSLASNPFWVHLDKKIINELNSVDKANPIAVEAYFINNTKSQRVKENLGFGWKVWSPSVPGGYISVSGIFIYFNDSIVSYVLDSRLPNEKRLTKRYTEWLGKTFQISSDRLLPIEFNLSSVLRPITQYDGHLQASQVMKELLHYMSPFSGLMYGYAGGMGMSLLENRKNFKDIQENISAEEVYMLMFSINPASRLTAIEYYKKHKTQLPNSESIDQWINTVFEEIPMVHTLMGCFGEVWESRLLVEFCLKIEDD